MNKIQIKLLSENAVAPTRAHATDAGLDIYASETVFIPVGSTRIVRTDVALSLKDGYVAKIEDRSSMASKGLRTGAGVVDSSYRGEIGIVLHNLTARSDKDSNSSSPGYKILKGDKIAQILIYKIETPSIEIVNQLDETQRNTGSFGSSGR